MELTRPFAENGDRQDFPVDTQGDGTMSLQQGFGAFYGLPPEEGGLFIQRPQFNQLMYLVSKGVIENKTSIETLESNYGSLAANTPKLLTGNLTWNVGSGGDYEDLQTALNETTNYFSINNYYINIKLKTGYVLNQQINYSYSNFGHVIISSESENKYDVDILSGKIIFSFNKCITPTISINLAPNKNDNGNTYIFYNTSCFVRISGTYTNCPNVFSFENCNSNLRSITVDNATKNIGSVNSGFLNIAGNSSYNLTIFKNCNKGLISVSQGDIYADSTLFKNCNTDTTGFYFNRGGRGSFNNAKFDNCSCSDSSYSFFQFFNGSIVNVPSSVFNQVNATNRCNITQNQLTSNGILIS